MRRHICDSTASCEFNQIDCVHENRIGEAQTDFQHNIISSDWLSRRRLLYHSPRLLYRQWRGLHQLLQGKGETTYKAGKGNSKFHKESHQLFQGKVRPPKKLGKNPKFHKAFRQIFDDWKVKHRVTKQLEQFTYLVFDLSNLPRSSLPRSPRSSMKITVLYKWVQPGGWRLTWKSWHHCDHVVMSGQPRWFTLCRPFMQILSLHGVMRDTLSNMVSCFLMSRQQAHMTTNNSQFSHIYIC